MMMKNNFNNNNTQYIRRLHLEQYCAPGQTPRLHCINRHRSMKLFVTILAFIALSAAAANSASFTGFKPKECDSLKRDADPDSLQRQLAISKVGIRIQHGIAKGDVEYVAKVIDAFEKCSEGTCGLPTIKKLFKVDIGKSEEDTVEEQRDPKECQQHGDNGAACIANPSCNFNTRAPEGEGCFLMDKGKSMPSEWFDSVRDAVFKSTNTKALSDAVSKLHEVASESGACDMEEKILQKTGEKIVKANKKKAMLKVKKKKKKSSSSSLSSNKTKPSKKKSICKRFHDAPKRCVKVEGCKYDLMKGKCKSKKSGGWLRI